MSMSITRILVAAVLATVFSNAQAQAAGNVTAAVVNGQLKITGDGSGNEIRIENGLLTLGVLPNLRVSFGLKVTGLNGTTVNGKAFQQFGAVNQGFFFDAKGGNDVLRVGTTGNGFNTLGNAIADMGTGADEVEFNDGLVSGNVVVRTGGAGDDDVQMDSTRVAGSVQVDTDSGHDTVDLDAIVSGEISIHSNGGDDGLTLNGACEAVTIDSGFGEEFVTLTIDCSGLVAVSTGGDDDQLAIVDSTMADLYVELNGGDDAVGLFNVLVENTAIFDGGPGNDQIFGQATVGAEVVEIDGF